MLKKNAASGQTLTAKTKAARDSGASASYSTLIRIGGKTIGEVRHRDRVFQKHIRGSIHFKRKPAGIAFDLATLHQAMAVGAVEAEVHNDENGDIYRASLATILARGAPFNHGYGDQICLTFAYWSRNGAATPPAPPKKPDQLSLFSETTS